MLLHTRNLQKCVAFNNIDLHPYVIVNMIGILINLVYFIFLVNLLIQSYKQTIIYTLYIILDFISSFPLLIIIEMAFVSITTKSESLGKHHLHNNECM